VAEREPAQLRERFQSTYGIDPAGKTLEAMSYYPEINGTEANVIEISPRGIGYEITASAAPEVPSGGWTVRFPEATPKDVAAIFMRVFQTWDGLRVLDALTITAGGRVELAFIEAEKKFSSDDYKKFKEWARGKGVRFVSSEVKTKTAHDKNPSSET